MSAPLVAILNTNDDLVELLRVAMEQAGLIVASIHVDSIRRGRASLDEFIKEHDPQVVVFDVCAPYDVSWRYLDHLREMPIMADRQFVLTSPNVTQAMEGIRRPERVFEIVGKPYDIDEFVDIVRQAVKAHHTRD